MAKYSWQRFKKNFLWGIYISLAAIVIAILMRIFLFASFKIPSFSMMPTVLAGDYILVNKQIPGPRVYRNFNFKKGGKTETKRFKGIRKIKRNDVLVFNYPFTDGTQIEMNLSVNYLKRCVAIPGDTFYIKSGIYKVKNSQDTLGCIFRQKELIYMSQKDFPPEIWNCFPNDTIHYHWNIKNFGPLYVPKKGDNLAIDTVNYILYKNLITYETDKTVGIRNGRVLLGDSAISQYTFGMNYYFMAGDYIFDSTDSRYWGLLPEDHIIGKAILVWKSKDVNNGKIRWERTFNTI